MLAHNCAALPVGADIGTWFDIPQEIIQRVVEWTKLLRSDNSVLFDPDEGGMQSAARVRERLQALYKLNRTEANASV